MNAYLAPSHLHGSAAAIASKSDLHRLLICAAVSDGPTAIRLSNPDEVSDDIRATARCLRALGAKITASEDRILVRPAADIPDAPLLDCAESGSTLRFLIPLAAALCTHPSFTGSGRLPERPIADLTHALRLHGVTTVPDTLPFSFSGRLHGGLFSLPGNVSSQYITGLLLALPLLHEDSRIRLTSPLQSASYISITLHALSRFGIQIHPLSASSGRDADFPFGGYFIPGNQTFCSPGTLSADGDWSNSAFFLTAGALDRAAPDGISVTGLNPDSPQGDRAIVPLLRQFGAVLTFGKPDAAGLCRVTAQPGPLTAVPSVDLTDIPDLLPILAAAAAAADGTTRFVGGERLRLKESDRIHSVCTMLTALGGKAEEQPDGLTVTGTPLDGGTVSSFHDHRIVMAASIAALTARGPTVIQDAEAVRKSYPSFFHDYVLLGGNADVI